MDMEGKVRKGVSIEDSEESENANDKDEKT